jgi:predicted lipoprotein with Yx(FWY)xxD motif
MSRSILISTAAACALLLGGMARDGALAQDGAAQGEPAEPTVGERAGEAIDRGLGAIGEAIDQGAETVREFDSEDAADLLRRGGEALGTAGERAGEYAERLAAQIDHGDQSRLTVATGEHGEYVADGEGRALYMFEADTRGEGGAEAQSACADACAEAWPPLVVEEAPEAGEQIQDDLIGTIERPDGAMQVTYGGWPLYYYLQDEGAGQTTGHDVEGFGAEWYLVEPSGEQLHD